MISKRWLRRSAGVAAVLLSAMVVQIVLRSRQITWAIAVVEECGGGISEDEFPPYFNGPYFVTFNVPGIPRPVRDSDAPRLADALPAFRRLERIDFSHTALGDSFFEEIAPRVSVQDIDISHTQCGHDGAFALARHRSCRTLRIHGLNLTEGTVRALTDRGITCVGQTAAGKAKEPGWGDVPESPPIVRTVTQEFVEAAFRGDVEAVQRHLRNGVSVDVRHGGPSTVFRGDDGGYPVAGARWTALHAAASARRPDMVAWLIEAGADLDLDDGYGATALYMSVDVYDRKNLHDECALLLIRAGAKVNTRTGVYIDGNGDNTPLHRAVVWNQRRAVSALIEAGADVNARTEGGMTPLHDAYLCGADQEIIDALLPVGADPMAKDEDGRIPSEWKLPAGFPELE
ncbi:ankyrin repeat domain-containing protein [Planctomyces sp. SH-PL14]|uniref:ankyrin repeat domain-containing protein n=1 Tax=Planctomyces sp. SH-PL14 TaxID=1632864 RepID=UPI0009463FC5|nr:ankyrin repeat domain-containing protein [Planctomyces sp. SH-PL14]